MPEHLRESIFARGVTSKPDVPGGRGIGLALVRLVSAQLGGTVDVSRRGPAAAPSSRSACRWPDRPGVPVMRDVLVVDDDFMVAEIHRRFVDRVDGFRAVGVARTGSEALAMAADLHPDLILLDVHLPDMTGLEVLQRLRSGGDRVGVIMITAARELDTVAGALDGGAADYLIKPFEFDQLPRNCRRSPPGTTRCGPPRGVDQSLIDCAVRRTRRPLAPASRCRRVSAPRRANWCSTPSGPPVRCPQPNALGWWESRGSARDDTWSTIWVPACSSYACSTVRGGPSDATAHPDRGGPPPAPAAPAT